MRYYTIQQDTEGLSGCTSTLVLIEVDGLLQAISTLTNTPCAYIGLMT